MIRFAVASWARRFGAARVAQPSTDPLHPYELTPPTAYEAVTRQMVDNLSEDLREIKGRLDGLLWMVAGALVLELALRLVGAA